MQFMLLIWDDEDASGKAARTPAYQAIVQQHHAFAAALDEAGIRKAGAGLSVATSARTVRNEGGTRTVHDGPFPETREQLAGYYLIEAADLDAAVEIARRAPSSPGGSIEVRAVMGG